MSRKLSYAVFGLGRYGQAVAVELAKNGAEVLAVDIDEEIVNSIASELPFCRCADVTDIDALTQMDISNIDVVVIAMASSLENSVMATMLCKEMGVKTVIAKCANEMNYRILSKIGADRVVFPEKESGSRLAKNLLIPDFVDLMELTAGLCVAQINVRPEWEGKSLSDLNLRKKYSINVAAVINGNNISAMIDPEMPLTKDMKLVIIADTAAIQKL